MLLNMTFVGSQNSISLLSFMFVSAEAAHFHACILSVYSVHRLSKVNVRLSVIIELHGTVVLCI